MVLHCDLSSISSLPACLKGRVVPIRHRLHGLGRWLADRPPARPEQINPARMEWRIALHNPELINQKRIEPPSLVLGWRDRPAQHHPPKLGSCFLAIPQRSDNAAPVRLRGNLRLRADIGPRYAPVRLPLTSLPRPPHHDRNYPSLQSDRLAGPAYAGHLVQNPIGSLSGLSVSSMASSGSSTDLRTATISAPGNTALALAICG